MAGIRQCVRIGGGDKRGRALDSTGSPAAKRPCLGGPVAASDDSEFLLSSSQEERPVSSFPQSGHHGVSSLLPAEPISSPIDSLPDDIIISIFTALSAKASSTSDLINAMLTCRRFCAAGMHPQVLASASADVMAVRARKWSSGAHAFLRRAADADNAEACYTLGMIEFYCLDNRRAGRCLMMKAALQDHAAALHSLAIIHFNGSSGGDRTAKNLATAVNLCSKAAAAGHVDAMRELGHCLQDGYGVTRNVLEGRRLLLEANALEMIFGRSLLAGGGTDALSSDGVGVLTSAAVTCGGGSAAAASVSGASFPNRETTAGAFCAGSPLNDGSSSIPDQGRGLVGGGTTSLAASVSPDEAAGNEAPLREGEVEGGGSAAASMSRSKRLWASSSCCSCASGDNDWRNEAVVDDDDTRSNEAMAMWEGREEEEKEQQEGEGEEATCRMEKEKIGGIDDVSVSGGEDGAEGTGGSGGEAAADWASGRGGGASVSGGEDAEWVSRAGGDHGGEAEGAAAGIAGGEVGHAEERGSLASSCLCTSGSSNGGYERVNSVYKSVQVDIGGLSLEYGGQQWQQSSPRTYATNTFLVDWFAEHQPAPGLRLCSYAFCGRPEMRRHEFRRCAACGCVNYCSRACQALDWKGRHKWECMPVAEWAEQEAEEEMGEGEDVLMEEAGQV